MSLIRHYRVSFCRVREQVLVRNNSYENVFRVEVHFHINPDQLIPI